MHISVNGRSLEEFDPMPAIKHSVVEGRQGRDPDGPNLDQAKHLVDIVLVMWYMDTVRKSEQIRLEYHPHLFPDDLENKRTRS